MTIRYKDMSQTRLTPSHFLRTTLASTIALISINVYANPSLTAMSVVQPSEQTTQLRLDFNETPTLPEAYQLDNPARLVLDFADVVNALPNRYNEVNQGAIKKVTTLNNDSTTRLIIGLSDTSNKAFTTIAEGNSLLVNVIDSSTPATNVTALAAPAPAYEPPAVKAEVYAMDSALDVVDPVQMAIPQPAVAQPDIVPQARQAEPKQTMVVKVNPLLNPAYSAQAGQSNQYAGLNDIKYTGSADGGGNISINLVNESIPVDIQRQGNKIIVRMTSATIPPNLVRQHNVSGGLVSSVTARNDGKNGTVTIAMAEDFEYQAYQAGNQVSITVKKPELLREPTLEEKQYSGEPISVDFQNVELRSVLHLLSQFTKMNIVASDSVSGSITLNLINVPWDQALDIILKSKNLGMRANGNVILVAPATELAEQEARELEAQQKVDTFLPLRTEYIHLSYAIATDVLTLISQGRNAGNNNDNRNDAGSLLSDRGTVTIDARTNTLIVKDTSQSIENIRALIAEIDVPVRQVMIEARIVSATDSFSKELGVKWGILTDGAATNRNLLVGGSDQTLADLKDFSVQTTTVNGKTVSYPSYSISRPDNLNVDLGVANAAGRIAFGLLNMSDLMIDLELSAMQADGRGEVISSPKILTMDKQTAKVSSGTQIPYQEAAASGATSTSFVEAALSLEATPNITPDGRIGLKLNISNGTPQVINGATAISQETLSTNVLVEDGQTIVLGGIFRNQTSNSVTKVPFLGDLPYVGKLFRKDSRLNDKQELLIFVTPKLVRTGTSNVR